MWQVLSTIRKWSVVASVDARAFEELQTHMSPSPGAQRSVEIKRRELTTGLKVVDCGIRWTCECLIQDKMARPYPKVAEKTSTAPMEEITYYLSIIDDCSHYAQIYFLKQMSDVEQRIRGYVRMTENQFGRMPRFIRSDQGEEYSSKALRFVDSMPKKVYRCIFSATECCYRAEKSILERDACWWMLAY